MFDNPKPGAVQPSARHLAQMRLAASKAGIPAQYAELMAEAGVTAATAEATAQGLAQLHQMTETFVNSGRLDQAAMLRITRHALKAGAAITTDDSAARAQAIAVAAGEEAQAIMAAAEPPGRTARPSDAGALIVPGRAVGNQAVPSRAEAMADGLLARMQAGHVPSHGREYASMRLDDMARLANGGGYAGRRSGATMFGGAMGNDDFRSALAIASNKVLLDSYEASESQIKKASRQVSAPDFRPINTVRVSGGVELGKVQENGEFTAGVINDAGEAFAVETYGKIFALTRQALVNDDLGSFEQSSRMFGQGAALTEARLFAGLLEMNAGAGPTLSDGRTLFHADHGNRAASGGVLSIVTLSAARVAMRRQKGLSGEAIQVQPALLVVPPELETTAQQLVAEITAASVDEVNPFTDTLGVLVDAHLTSATRWYLAAKPGRPDGLQHAYLDGATGPQVFTREGFEVDATEFKVRLDFGCGFVDHRAWYMNPGA
ncbi:phage major capsid protein [Paracoccus aminovorans]|uniref:phage major capsid protein n=1 Tax=Paracoccus aminovorans TaxID=34004 RepID=UPI002B257DA8|nr:Mu-like prophage major head subunit gpT family protein [Paracoccus aminovorans]